MCILGLGIGTSMPIMTLAVQNTTSPADMGAATSAVNFFRSLGSAFGVAVFGTIMTTRLANTLADRLPGSDLIDDKSLLSTPEAIRQLPADEFAAVAAGVAEGVATVFLVALPVVAIAFGLSWLLQEVPLRDDVHVSTQAVEGFEEMSAT